MVLSVLTFAAILVGGWVFTAIKGTFRDARPVARPSRLLDTKVSLWSLICFFFLPKFNTPPSSTRRLRFD